MKEPKSIAVMLLKKRKAEADDSGDELEGDTEPSMPPLEEVMQEFIDAVKAGDAKGAAKAFRGAVACQGDDEETEPEDDDE